MESGNRDGVNSCGAFVVGEKDCKRVLTNPSKCPKICVYGTKKRTSTDWIVAERESFGVRFLQVRSGTCLGVFL